ncbi:MAG: ribonuclease HI [Clostridia bacterium]|nr:ribonuclease HI [Clostridia bacterium]
MKKVHIYTDGSCRFNPGPGGWGAILVYGKHEKELCGGEAQTTNNRMELTAAIEALKALKEPCKVHLCSDSKYLIDGLEQGWAKAWREKGWKKPDRSVALNPDLWEELLRLADIHRLEYEWVKGHAGHPYNERCDAMAQREAEKFPAERAEDPDSVPWEENS